MALVCGANWAGRSGRSCFARRSRAPVHGDMATWQIRRSDVGAYREAGSQNTVTVSSKSSCLTARGEIALGEERTTSSAIAWSVAPWELSSRISSSRQESEPPERFVTSSLHRGVDPAADPGCYRSRGHRRPCPCPQWRPPPCPSPLPSSPCSPLCCPLSSPPLLSSFLRDLCARAISGMLSIPNPVRNVRLLKLLSTISSLRAHEPPRAPRLESTATEPPGRGFNSGRLRHGRSRTTCTASAACCCRRDAPRPERRAHRQRCSSDLRRSGRGTRTRA